MINFNALYSTLSHSSRVSNRLIPLVVSGGATTITYFIFSSSSCNAFGSSTSSCQQQQFHESKKADLTDHNEKNQGVKDKDYFFGYFAKDQLFEPKKPYPAWDDDWDGKESTTYTKDTSRSIDGNRSSDDVIRHIILVRHGQYNETFEDDAKRKLTKLGRQQAHLTGQRLAEMMKGIEDDEKFAPCNIKLMRVSNMTRAKETASIIGEYLPKHVIRENPDPLLNEGIPAQIIPTRPELDIEDDLAKNGTRIEKAFTKYFFRKTKIDDMTHTKKPWWFFQTIKNSITHSATESSHSNSGTSSSSENLKKERKHEFEIIVCHGNVIRYFLCRALQLPPEAWLRFSTFNCSMTYLMIMPNGRVSCRMLGDIGHLGYGNSTFSMKHGFVW